MKETEKRVSGRGNMNRRDRSGSKRTEASERNGDGAGNMKAAGRSEIIHQSSASRAEAARRRVAERAENAGRGAAAQSTARRNGISGKKAAAASGDFPKRNGTAGRGAAAQSTARRNGISGKKAAAASGDFPKRNGIAGRERNPAKTGDVNHRSSDGSRPAKTGGVSRRSSARRQGKARPSRRGIPGRYRKPLMILLALAAAAVIIFLILSGLKVLIRRVKPDVTPPVIELTRNPDYFVGPGQEYEEEGFTATDDRDGDLTESVRIFSSGDSTICYEVTDSAGNTTVEYREIPFIEEAVAQNSGEGDEDSPDSGAGSGTRVSSLKNIDPGYVPDEKVIYLTFDDGPGEYTEYLLEILDYYDVHATFFVTGAFPYYEDMIRKEYEAGHSIGVHTYSHDFEKIYSDEKAFWADFEEMEKIIEKQTGQRTRLMRFAGGSSNTMSADYTKGIMTRLAKEAEKKGYQYFDWNVSSGDGSSTCTGQEVVDNIIRQLQNQDHSVVLCHDTKEFTVHNIEYVIAWALENGYTFLPLNEESETAHHAILN